MSDEANTRSHLGSAADRKPPPKLPAVTAGYSLGAGVLIATGHYLVKSRVHGAWTWATPDDALIEMWAMTALPVVHQIVSIAMGLLNRVKHWANNGDENEPA